MIMPSQVQIIEDHRRDLLAYAARARLIAAAPPSPSATPRPVGRIRAGLRHAVTSLVALAESGLPRLTRFGPVSSPPVWRRH